MKVLNIGGGSKRIAIPNHYDGWEHVLLDIQHGNDVDVVCDATKMVGKVDEKSYDAIYSSHNLEHYYRHQLFDFFKGVKYAMKPEGFVEIHVPNIKAVFEDMAHKGKDIEDIAYESKAGPVKYIDMIYGLSSMLSEDNHFMSHKNGFTVKSLATLFWTVGFNYVFIGENKEAMSIVSFCFSEKPGDELMKKLKLIENDQK